MSEKTSSGRLFMVPIDSSLNSEKAFDWYLKNVHKEGDRLGIVHVHEPPVMSEAFGVWDRMVIENDKQWKEDFQTSLKKSKSLVDKFQKKAKESGVDSEVYVTTNTKAPGQLICDLADKEKADGIVMGSRGLNFIRRTFLGSVSHYVVHHSNVPVTLTKHCETPTQGWSQPSSSSFKLPPH